MKRIETGILCGGIALAFLTGCSQTLTPTAEGQRSRTTAARRVSVVEVKRARLSNEVTLTAEFHPYQEVDVMAKVSGYLKSIHVDVGDRVQAGQLLAVIEVPEMDDDMRKIAEAIERSQAELDRARNDVERTETAHEMVHLSFTRLAAVQKSRPGLIAQQEIDTARNRDLLAESQISNAKSSVDAAGHALKIQEAEAARARTLQAYTRVTAPFSGVVSKRYADTGAMIQAGTNSHTQAMPVVRISQTSTLRLVLPVPESAVPMVRLGAPIEVKVESLKRGFAGRVARFSGRISTATRTMDTEVDVPNAQGLLVPGMFAEATMRLDDHPSALAVPLTAVDKDKGVDWVTVVTPQKQVERRRIIAGMETADYLEVRDGLKEGEMVVIGARNELKEGQRVEPKRLEEKAGA